MASLPTPPLMVSLSSPPLRAVVMREATVPSMVMVSLPALPLTVMVFTVDSVTV